MAHLRYYGEMEVVIAATIQSHHWGLNLPMTYTMKNVNVIHVSGCHTHYRKSNRDPLKSLFCTTPVVNIHTWITVSDHKDVTPSTVCGIIKLCNIELVTLVTIVVECSCFTE